MDSFPLGITRNRLYPPRPATSGPGLPPVSRAIPASIPHLWPLPALVVIACAPSLESQLWKATRSTDTIPAYEAFLERYPGGPRSEAARERLQALYEALKRIESVHVEVRQSYVHGRADREIDGLSLPVAPTAAALLRQAGLRIARDGAGAADGVLGLRLEGRAVSQPYAPVNERNLAGSAVTRRYAGAGLRGSVWLSTAGERLYDQSFDGRYSPPERIDSADFPRPEDAPFEAAFDAIVAPELAVMIGRLYGPGPLVETAMGGSSALRVAAIGALGTLGDSTSVQPLRTMLGETANFQLQGALVTALGRIGDGRATPDLMEVLRSAFDPALRASAAEALGRIGGETAVPLLIEVLSGDAPLVRRQAADALRSLTGERWGSDAEAWRRWWESRGSSPAPPP